MHPHRSLGATALGALLLPIALASCGSDSPSAIPSTTTATAGPSATALPTDTAAAVDPVIDPVIDPGDGGVYDPQLDPASFVDVIDNPYLPMPVGARWLYEGESDGEIETIEIVVTGDRKEIMGISAFVVRDTVMIGGELAEDTFDWFAQDADGNVWYLGEDVKDYENGQVVSTAGSWEAGVDGALAGIVMPAAPAKGDVYRQEFYEGEAEDMMEFTEVGATLTVPAGSFDQVVVTHDWTPLEPDTIEEKFYAAGVGKVSETKIAGGSGFAELVEYDLVP